MDKHPIMLFPGKKNQVVEVSLAPFFKGEVPLPPSTNQAYKIIHTREYSRIGPSEMLEQFKRDAQLLLYQSDIDQQQLLAIRESKRKVPLAASLKAYFATEWKRDLDGIVKFSIDAVFDYLQLNDNLVVRLEAEKLVDAEHSRVEIELTVIIR